LAELVECLHSPFCGSEGVFVFGLVPSEDFEDEDEDEDDNEFTSRWSLNQKPSAQKLCADKIERSAA
jgi:hypothetical protein